MCSRDREGTANGSVTLSRVSILVGFICALSYFGAFVGTGWVYTKEPYRLTNLNLYTSVTFKIGLWRACHSFKRINSTITLPMPSCTMISYTNWSQLAIHPVALRSDMDSTISVISRIRWCAVFVGSGFVLILVGFVCSVAGHFYKDNKTLLASAMYTLSGLSLAAGLFVFVCVLTDSFAIHTTTPEEQSWNNAIDSVKDYHDYKYGWCFLVAGTLCIFVEMVALLCMTVHHRRCQTIAQIIKNILPAEEQQKPSTTTDTSYFSSTDVNYIEKVEPCKSDTKTKPNEETFVTSETPPDICSTFLNVEYAEDTVRSCDIKDHSDVCSLRMKKGNFATLNTRNYRCLKYPSSLGSRRYSTMSGCSSMQGSVLDGPSSSSSSSSTRPNVKCHQSATSCIQSTMPRIRNTPGGISTKYATVDRQCKKSEIQAEVQTLDGENFGL